MSIVIPDEALAGFEALLQLEANKLNTLIKAFEAVTPAMQRSDIITAVSSKSGIAPQMIDEIVPVLMGLNMAKGKQDIDASKIARDAVKALKEAQPDALPRVGDWESFTTCLVQLLKASSRLNLNLKIVNLIAEHQHAYCMADSRIITDLRPIFPDEVSDGPAAVAIIHNLKICYHEAGEHKEFFVALDEEDLGSLSLLLVRAEKKAEKLRSVVGPTPMEYLDTRRDAN